MVSLDDPQASPPIGPHRTGRRLDKRRNGQNIGRRPELAVLADPARGPPSMPASNSPIPSRAGPSRTPARRRPDGNSCSSARSTRPGGEPERLGPARAATGAAARRGTGRTRYVDGWSSAAARASAPCARSAADGQPSIQQGEARRREAGDARDRCRGRRRSAPGASGSRAMACSTCSRPPRSPRSSSALPTSRWPSIRIASSSAASASAEDLRGRPAPTPPARPGTCTGSRGRAARCLLA